VRQIGSFQRRTKIRPIDFSDQLDVDALVVLGDARAAGSHGGVTADGALNLVLRALRRSEIYGQMKPETDAPTVVLDYADSFRLELAVGYRDLTGARPRPSTPCYLVSGANGMWLPARLRSRCHRHSELNNDRAVDGRLVPTIKVIKHIARANKVPLKSFHVEVLTALLLPSVAWGWAQRGLTWESSTALPMCFAT